MNCVGIDREKETESPLILVLENHQIHLSNFQESNYKAASGMSVFVNLLAIIACMKLLFSEVSQISCMPFTSRIG